VSGILTKPSHPSAGPAHRTARNASNDGWFDARMEERGRWHGDCFLFRA